jgi:hypothetical protein
VRRIIGFTIVAAGVLITLLPASAHAYFDGPYHRECGSVWHAMFANWNNYPNYECGSAAIPHPRSASRLTSGRAARSRSASAKCSPRRWVVVVCCAWAGSFSVEGPGSVFTHHRGRLLEWREFRPTAFP